MATFTTYVLYHKDDEDSQLTAEKAFVAIALFNIMKFPMAQFAIIISNIIEVRRECPINEGCGQVRLFVRLVYLLIDYNHFS